jgi:phage gp45-like
MRMPFEGINRQPVNQDFVAGESASILVLGGNEMTGVVESFTVDEQGARLTLLIAGESVTFEYIAGQWNQIDAPDSGMKEAA